MSDHDWSQVGPGELICLHCGKGSDDAANTPCEEALEEMYYRPAPIWPWWVITLCLGAFLAGLVYG